MPLESEGSFSSSSYLKMYGEAPFGDLAHGAVGIREDFFGVDRESAVLLLVRLVAMKKRHANKRSCHSPGVLVLGGGVQIATTHFHTYSHGLVLTTRVIFSSVG
jgi:hypothetical protein